MRVAGILRERLEEILEPSTLLVEDQSAAHAGHAGARAEGDSHFRVVITAAGFSGRSRIERQRMVLAAVGDLMQTDIHALVITARAPGEP
jgi:BolA protein